MQELKLPCGLTTQKWKLVCFVTTVCTKLALSCYFLESYTDIFIRHKIVVFQSGDYSLVRMDLGKDEFDMDLHSGHTRYVRYIYVLELFYFLL